MHWKDQNLTWHFVEKWAAERPQAEALVYGEERLTWRQFKRQMDWVAKAFLEAGVQKGDCVAMLSMARNEFLTTFMAAGKVGAMWLGLSPKSSLDELRYIVGHAQPTVLIVLREYQGRDFDEDVRALLREFYCIRKALVLGEPFDGADSFTDYALQDRERLDVQLARRAASTTPDDDALLMYTSGSTGRPKGVVHTHRSILANVAVEQAQFGFSPTSRALLHFPINHVAADVEIGFTAVYAGSTVVHMDRFDPAESLRTVERERITVLGQVPTMFLLQFQSPLFQLTDLSSVEIFVWAGAAAPKTMVATLSQIAAKTGARLLTGYGSTEVGGFITYTEPGDNAETLYQTAGRIVAPFELKIVGNDRSELPDGTVGEIVVRGETLMKGYYHDPEGTAEVVDANGWYYTGDLARLDARGYLHICGRKSEMFKSGGENVFPREIEEVLNAHPAVVMSAVIGVPDPTYQEVGRAFVMLRPGEAVTEDELRAYCKEWLANFKVPRRFDLRAQLPLLATGKVNKPALKALLALEPD